jgi:hypothetical protein
VANRRPRIELRAPAASPQEAAAVVAALERFLRETAPPPPREAGPRPWQRAALAEGIERDPGAGRPS